jgi:transposase
LERAVAPFRRKMTTQDGATRLFETPPGKHLRIDFGQERAPIGSAVVPVYISVMTGGYSRLSLVQAFRYERQSTWLAGLQAAFRHFGAGSPDVLLDNAGALVDQHDTVTRAVRFNTRLLVFAGTGTSSRVLAHRIGRGPRARTSAASAT